MKYIAISFFAVVLLITPWMVQNFPQGVAYIDNLYGYVGDHLVAALLHKPVTISELKARYDEAPKKKIRVLIVPGHEPDFGGTVFNKLKERDLNVELANNLRFFLQNNGHYEVVMTRDYKSWNPIFTEYFKNNWESIISFFKESKQDTLHFISIGKITKPNAKISHNDAPQNVAYRLYGINKWGNENAVDIAIHIHFNDYARRDISSPGEYSGFAIYVPERIYANSTTTRAIAEAVFKRIAKYNPVSNLPNENAGVIDAPDLIAIGAYNTSDAASMLIEYGYIYEPQIVDERVRESTLKDFAFQTYLGLQDFFGSGNDVSFAYDTLMLPHIWNNDLTVSDSNTKDVLALQTALLIDGVYPGQGKTKNDCPRTGRFGPCTREALNVFQKKYKINGEEGMVGDKTKKVLNERYSGKTL